MMIMLHIIIALAGLATSIAGLAFASRRLITSSYGLITGTVLTGCALMLADPAQMLHVCVSGLVYVATATSLTHLAQRRVAQRSSKQLSK